MTARAVATLFAIVLGIGAAVDACTPAWAHDPYADWKTRNGVSCCHDRDCAPATASTDEEGRLWMRQNGQTYFVPKEAILQIPSPDGRSHACVIGGTVICAVVGPPRS